MIRVDKDAGTYAHRVEELDGSVEVRSGFIAKIHDWGVLAFTQTCPSPRNVVVQYSAWADYTVRRGGGLSTFDGLFLDVYRPFLLDHWIPPSTTADRKPGASAR